MKKIVSLILALIVFGAISSAQEIRQPTSTSGKTNDNGTNFYDEDARFRIKFPNGATPTKKETPVETAIGTIQMTSYMYEKGSGSVYMVAISKYPKEKVESSDPTILLEGAKSGYLENLGLEVKKSRHASIDGHPGIYFEASNSSGYYTAVVDYFVENTLFQLAILQIGSAITKSEIDDFIFSFELKGSYSGNYFNGDPAFEVNFFGQEPTKKTKPVDTALGELQMTTYMYEKSNAEVFMVALSDYPVGSLDGMDKSNLLESARDGYIGNLNMTVTNERKITTKGNPGIYFEAHGGGYYTAAADYIVGDRLYQVAILNSSNKPTKSNIQDFIFSFRLK